MITNPDDDEFLLECHVPGKDTPEFGIVTCRSSLTIDAANHLLNRLPSIGLEDQCLGDIPLGPDTRKPDGGRSIGLGSFDAYRVSVDIA